MGGSAHLTQLVTSMSNYGSQSETTICPPRTIRVLLVDDSEFFLGAFARYLSGCENVSVVGQARNGTEGLAMAELLEPDLVISDMSMPGLGGFEMVKTLRHKFPSMRLIIASATESTAVRIQSMGHGADAFIPKQHLETELPQWVSRLFPGVTFEETPEAS